MSFKNKKSEMSVERRASGLASKVLRHDPGYIGLELSSDGWASVTQLLKGFEKKGLVITKDQLKTIVETNNKKRFELSGDGNRIRAVQGHSVEVDLEFEPKEPPMFLFHGTVPDFLESIFAQGLQKRSRNHVHLSADIATATQVGSRRGKPVILIIDALEAHKDGVAFYQAKNGVWLAESVDPKYIKKADLV